MQTTTFSSPFLSRFVFSIDDRLRRRHGVFEFTTDPTSILRLQVHPSSQTVVLRDGTRCSPGDRIIDLHLWNEQLPVMAVGSLRWAHSMSRSITASLRELQGFLAATPELDDVTTIRASMGFGTRQQAEQLARLASSFGFERHAAAEPVSLAARLHLFGENILISLMVAARNRAALRLDSLKRDRVQVFLSRRVLEERYAARAPRRAVEDRHVD